jgi:hypothetical protein
MIGATANNLLVLIATYNGGGSGTFYTLHILDVSGQRAFDMDGGVYQRINVTSVRNVALGDRWEVMSRSLVTRLWLPRLGTGRIEATRP